MADGSFTSQFDSSSAPDFERLRGLESPVVVTWGDSTAYFIGLNLRRVFNTVVNRATSGAGLDNVIPVQSLDGLPAGAAVLMSIGGNDVEGLIGKPQSDINDYAARVIALAQKVRRQGAVPILIGHGTPPGPYTGPVPGGVSHWHEPGFYENWVETMNKMNDAISREAKVNGITWSQVDGRVPAADHADDNLHYNVKGSRKIAANALKDAGFF